MSMKETKPYINYLCKACNGTGYIHREPTKEELASYVEVKPKAKAEKPKGKKKEESKEETLEEAIAE